MTVLRRCVRFALSLLQCLRRPLLSDDDDEDAVMAKTIFVALAVTVLPNLGLLLVVQRDSTVIVAAVIAGVAVQAGVCLGWLHSPRLRLEVVYLAGYLASIFVGDVVNIATGDRRWPLTVLVMDCALVMNVAPRYTITLLVAVVAYLVVTTVDVSTTGFYRDLGDEFPWLCDCSDPPCVRGPVSAVNELIWSGMVFLIDFFLTRGFSSGLRHQMAVVRQAIGVVEQIAQQLARYEVEEGRAVLQSDESAKLPDGLREALLRLLDNLDEYRPFLPESMLVREGVDLSTAEPPGLGQAEPTVTLCFTDIQSSTELWEAYPQGMHTALQTHNDVMRTVAKCSGYEVKVIGDAFMLAFKSAEDGCRFALDAQEALAEAKWPSELLQHPLCTPVVGEDGRMLWGGPRVRIGVNCGAVRVEKNPVTGRCDYFGPPVNTAARVEACLRHGGLTGVTKAVLDELTPAAMDSLGGPVLVPLGGKELKGVGERVEVTVLLNRHHAERERIVSAHPVGGPAIQAAIRSASTRESFASMRTDTQTSLCSSAGGTGTRRKSAIAPRERLQRRAATCATFRIRNARGTAHLGTALEQMLEAVEQAADMTQGLMVGVMSMQCLVVWNGPRVCGDHYGQCLRASDVVRRSLSDEAAAGACSGLLTYGSVAAGRRKHATAAGGCVELSAALAEGAEMRGEAMLAAATFGAYCGTQRRATRCAEWGVHGSDDVISVWLVTEPTQTDDRWDALEAAQLLVESLDVSDGAVSFSERDRIVVLGGGVQSGGALV